MERDDVSKITLTPTISNVKHWLKQILQHLLIAREVYLHANGGPCVECCVRLVASLQHRRDLVVAGIQTVRKSKKVCGLRILVTLPGVPRRIYKEPSDDDIELPVPDSPSRNSFGELSYADIFETVLHWLPVNHKTLDALSHSCPAVRYQLGHNAEYAHNSYVCSKGCHVRFHLPSHYLAVPKSDIRLGALRHYRRHLHKLEYLNVSGCQQLYDG